MIKDKITKIIEHRVYKPENHESRTPNEHETSDEDKKIEDRYNSKDYLTKSTEKSVQNLKILLDTYITTVTTFGLLSTFLPEPVAISIGGIVGIAGLLTREKSITKKIKEKIGKHISPIMQKIGNLYSIIPFKYPVVIAEGAKHQEIISTLDKLPLKIVNNLSLIEINNQINDKYEAWGLAIDRIYRTPIYLHSNPYPYTIREVLIHEIGHVVDIESKIIPSNYKSSIFFILPKYPWGVKNFVSLYAQTNPQEDFAESFLTFNLDPQKLKETSLYKYEYIKNIYEQNFLEKLFDNKLLRNIGKELSNFMSKFPVIRHILDVLSFYSSHKAISIGLEKILEADNNQKKMIQAKFTLLSGLLTLKKSIYSLPLTILNLFVSKILDNKKIENSPKYSQILSFIQKGLNLSLGFTIGPIGISIYQALQTDSTKKNKIMVLISGLITTLVFSILKLSFPTFIPITNILETISVTGITELIKRKLSE